MNDKTANEIFAAIVNSSDADFSDDENSDGEIEAAVSDNRGNQGTTTVPLRMKLMTRQLHQGILGRTLMVRRRERKFSGATKQLHSG